MRALALAMILPVLAACGPDTDSVPSQSSEDQVTGVMTRVDHHSEDYSVTITLVTERRLETVMLPQRELGKPPSDAYVALYQKTIGIEPGRSVVVRGTRDERGVLIVEKIEVLK